MEIADRLIGNPAVLRRINRVRLMNQLRLARGSSRVELARMSGLDPKTVTNLTNELVDEGLVTSVRTQASGRGRPAERLALDAGAALALGVDIGAQQVTAVLMDLAGTVRDQWRRSYDVAKTGAFLIGKAREAVTSLIAPLSEAQKKTIHGLGVCVPGFLRREERIVLRSVNIRGFREFSITEAFGDFGPPVIVEESSRSMALAEKWFGARKWDGNLVCLDLGYGIGMGIIHRGVLYRGANEASGEIGHTVVDTSGPVCHCGKKGCLEAVASGRALGELAAGLKIGRNRAGARGAVALYEAALNGSHPARQALNRAGEHIGIAVANVINLFDPGLVVLNGGLVRAGDLLTGRLRETVEQHRLKGAGRGCRIEISTLGGPAAAMGAAMLPLRTYFEFDNIQL